MAPSRRELIQRLVRFDVPLEPTLAALQGFGWDCDRPLIKLDAPSLRSVLHRYVSGSLTATDIEAWANAIECRDDIDISEFGEIIFELANPILTRQLSPSVAQELMTQLGGDLA